MHDRRVLRRALIGLALVVTLATVACWPTSRYVGVNYVVSEQTLPLWMKAAEFVDRDASLANMAYVVLGGIAEDEAKAAAALRWTLANVRNTPSGFPVIDDHVWHIVIRGYGEADQQADVFTTLLTYQGVRAYWAFIGPSPREIPLSYVWINGRWRVYDVRRGFVFRTATGELATPQDLAADRSAVRAAAAGAADLDEYLTMFDGYAPPQVPDVVHAEMQMPGRRLWYEARKLFGRQGREWQIRPPASNRGEGRTQ
jgi:hypothetical protein